MPIRSVDAVRAGTFVEIVVEDIDPSGGQRR
jgi:hypothetical protein